MTPTGRKPAAKADAPRPVTKTYLRNAALHYLAQRAASMAMVRQTLTRRAARRSCVKRPDEETRVLIEAVIAELVSLGMIDDRRFAEVRATTLAGRGLSKSRIAHGLKAKGVGKETVTASSVVTAIDDIAQARRYIVRKRLGPHRRNGSAATHDKDLRALARAGFTYQVAVRALALECEEM